MLHGGFSSGPQACRSVPSIVCPCQHIRPVARDEVLHGASGDQVAILPERISEPQDPWTQFGALTFLGTQHERCCRTVEPTGRALAGSVEIVIPQICSRDTRQFFEPLHNMGIHAGDVTATGNVRFDVEQ